MRLKKLLASVLSLCMALLLSACGGKTVIEAYDTAPTLDFDAAWAKHAPDEVVFYVDGEAVTWRELFYQITYFAEAVSATEGVTIRSWDQACSLYTTPQGGPVAYGTIVLQDAVRTLTQYHAVHKNLTDAGAVLGKDALDSVELMRQTAIDENFGGDEEAFDAYLESMYCTEALWTWFCQVDALYAYDGFRILYGSFGEKLPDADVMAYAAGDPDGAWTEYVQIEQIYLYNEEDAEDENAAEATGEPSPADTVLAALDSAGDRETAFRALYAEYNENPELDAYEGGRCVYDGDVDDAIYHAALELAEYEYTVVPVDGADVIVMRVPVEPDAGVFFDETDGTMYTLRYYAAWQDYSNRINGEDGWVESAETSWADGFGDFDLQSAFEE